jgi:S-adenosylmethionine/arginine decarboxylase-like enzyme
MIVDALGCHPQMLRSVAMLEALFAEIISGLHLKAIGEPRWHTVDGEAGVTGLQMLSESRPACHTYPEARDAALSLSCCRPDLEEWPWRERLMSVLGAHRRPGPRVAPKPPRGRRWGRRAQPVELTRRGNDAARAATIANSHQ